MMCRRLRYRDLLKSFRETLPLHWRRISRALFGKLLITCHPSFWPHSVRLKDVLLTLIGNFSVESGPEWAPAGETPEIILENLEFQTPRCAIRVNEELMIDFNGFSPLR